MNRPSFRHGLGFTLIELLATITILAILVAFLGQVFSQASTAWERGSQQVIRNADGKAVLDLIARELEAAIVDEQFGLRIDRENLTGWPIDYSSVWFTTTGGAPNDGRQFEQVYYRVNRDQYADIDYRATRLNRNYRNLDDVQPRSNAFVGAWWDRDTSRFATEPVIENVVRFDAIPYSTSVLGSDPKPTGGTEFNTVDRTRHAGDRNRSPAYIDLYLQITSPEAMRRADAILSPPINEEKRQRARELLDANSNVLFKRVYPRMRNAVN